MALKALLEQLSDVPEALRELYTEVDGRFVLDLEGVEDHPNARALKNALDKERESRRKANVKAEELAAKFDKYKDIDPDAARDALQKLEELKDKGDLDKGDIDAVVARQTERMRADFEAKIAALAENNDALTGTLKERETSLADVKIFNAVKDSALTHGARATALDDIVNRARGIFRLVNGEVTPFKSGTDEVYYGKTGEPIKISEYMETLTKDAGHLFEANSGGGAKGSGGNRPGAGERVIDINTDNAIGKNLEAIAKGDVTFVEGS